MRARLADWAMLRLLPSLAAWIIRLLRSTLRVEAVGGEIPRSLWSEGQPVILAFWHDQLLLMVKGYEGPGAQILISASRDGELIARTMEQFGMRAVRGSSTRGGSRALKAMVDMAKSPWDLVITPDGPKGPRHVVKEGVAQLARLTRRPVIPMAFVCSRGHRFASWDRFLLPYPFARAVYAFGPPVYWQPGEEVAAFRLRLEDALHQNDRQARTCLESSGVSAV